MADVEQLIRMTSSLTDGVTRLREIVLHAAVHGTLVSQDPSDEPADALLARSRAAVVRQTQEGKTKREKSAAALEPSEQHFELPTGWVWARIVDTGQYINGLAFKPSDWKSKGRPIIRIQNLSGRNPEFNYTDGTFDPSVVVHDGDILVSWSATLDAFIWRGVEGVLNQHIFRVLPAPLVDKAYLFWLLKWVIRRMAASDHVHGLVMGHINRGPFLAFPVPIPPLAEQKRIVAKVDELMALCDRLEAQLQERDARSADLAKAALARFSEAPTVENLEYLFHQSYAVTAADFRRSILSLAVQGILVPQDPSDVPADALLEAIQREKLALAKRGLLKRAEPVELEPDSALPAGWTLATLAGICISVTDGDHLPPPKAEKGVPFLVIGDVRWGGIDFESCRYVERAYFNKLDWIRKPIPGDVLYTLVGSFGIPVPVETDRPFCVQRHIGILRPSEHVDRRYLAFALASDSVLQQVTAIATGTAQKTIPLAGLRKVKIPVPPLAEQRRIVAKVEELMALVDQLEAQVAASEEAGTKLLDALVAELAPSN
jgi:type I restriction enzyme S subunit